MKEEFIPQPGDTYWYVSVNYCCNFGNVKVLRRYYKPNEKSIFMKKAITISEQKQKLKKWQIK